jgi:hypothetical protein
LERLHQVVDDLFDGHGERIIVFGEFFVQEQLLVVEFVEIKVALYLVIARKL